MGDTPEPKPTPGPPPAAPPAPAHGGTGWLIAIGLVLALAVGAYVAWRFQLLPLGTKEVAKSTEPQRLVIRYTLAAPLDAGQRPPGPVYIAEVRGDSELQLSFQVGGVVDQIGPSRMKNWEPGTVVPAGTELARLKQEDFVNRVTAARARTDLARVTYERLEKLYKTDTIPKQKLDQADADLKGARAELAAAEQALNETVLNAPWEGTILERAISAAETVSPGRPVLRFGNLKRMAVIVGVPDTAISQVKVDQEVPVAISALAGRTFTGRVSQVAVAGEEGSRLFKVQIKVPNPDGIIKSGMTASVSFVPPDNLPRDAVWVPLAALTAAKDAPGQLAVYVIDAAGKAHKRPVATDEIAGNLVMVTKGLKAGDKVVVTGVSTLFDGAAVDARPATEGFN